MFPTPKAPACVLPPALHVPDPVTAIRAYGCQDEHPLKVTQSTFSVGSSLTCDVRIPGEYVSSRHCQLVRREQRLRVEDLESCNGTFFRGRKEVAFEITPGDTFHVATARLMALDEAMRIARPVVTEVLGWARQSAIDDVLISSVLDGPILVVGPRGGGQLELIRAIHDMSIRRNEPLIDVSFASETRQRQLLIDRAERGTIVLSVTDESFDERLLNTIRSSENGPRLVLRSPSLRAALHKAKLIRLTSMTPIEILPLRERLDEIPRLLDVSFAKTGTDLRLADLSLQNQHVLLGHHWRGNLGELRRIAAIIASLVRLGTMRKAASALGIPRSTMQYWINRFQVTFPLMAMAASPPSLEGPGI